MANDRAQASELRNCFDVTQGVPHDADYALVRRVGAGYAARSREGFASLLLPLTVAPVGAVGRRTEGLELIPHSSTRFVDGERSWVGPAASLVCRNTELVDSFAVLATDILKQTANDERWEVVLSAVEDWLSLLAPKGRPTSEAELGIWGELWFLSRGEGVQRLLPGWLGPDGDATDFMYDGLGAEVKTSRVRHRHFVSQVQIDRPLGDLRTWLVSIWAKGSPGGIGSTVPALVDEVVGRAADPSHALRRILSAGYSPADRGAYATAFVVLEEPAWFAAAHIPRVRAADPGVSRLRYQADLDEHLRADTVTSARLWQHFHATPYSP